jgi:hypothetical protein
MPQEIKEYGKMAEVTLMRNNVLGRPIYGLPYVISFPLLDEDGDPVTGATCDSEISKNGNTAVDCHNEGVEIAFDTATNKGMYYLALTGSHTGTETAADSIAVTIYGGATTIQATCLTFYPAKLPKILSGTVGATGNDTTHVHIPDGVAIDDFYNGCVLHLNGVNNDECRMITDYVASTKLATLNLALDAAPTASTSTYDVYMTEVAIASIIALWTGCIPNAVAGANTGLQICGSNAAAIYATLTVTAALTTGSIVNSGVFTQTGTHTISALTITNAFTAGSNAVPWNAAWDAEVQSECDDALVALSLDHLCAVATAGADMTTEVIDGSILSRIISNSDTSLFVPATHSLQVLYADVHGHISGLTFTVASQVDVNVVDWKGATAPAMTGDAYAEAVLVFAEVATPDGIVVADVGNTVSTFKTNLTSAVNDFWVGAFVKIKTGNLTGQVKKISAYTGATKFITVASPFTAVPEDDVTFDIINR